MFGHLQTQVLIIRKSKMAVSFTQGVIRVEKLAIFCASGEVNEWQIREFFLEKWKLLSSYLDHGTILFIAGVHGKVDGQLAEDADSLESMIRQFNVEAMNTVRENMTERKIKAEFLQVQSFIKSPITKDIDKNNFITAIKAISPQMIVMVICYSQLLDLKFLLEESGIFSEVRLNRDMCIQSRGKILELSKVQKEFLQTMAEPENITKKNVTIQGQVGSGKTLLGVEVLKMKVAHYLRFYGLSAEEGREQIRVIIVIFNGESVALKAQLGTELTEDIGKHAHFEIHNENLETCKLKDIVETLKDYAKFKATIILVDECFMSGIALHDYTVEALEHKLKVDYIHCIKHSDLGLDRIDGWKREILTEKVQIAPERILVTLLQRQRSSQQILEISYFMKRHKIHQSFNHEFADIPHAQESFSGSTPKWVEIKDAKEFVKYAEENLSSFKGEAIVIRWYKCAEIPEISSLCSKLNWKYYKYDQVRGHESSMVIIYDFFRFDFESFTRAKHNLLIVTISGKK